MTCDIVGRSVGQKGSAGVRKAVGYNMSSFANSPVNGLLYMTGSLGASCCDPADSQQEYTK